MFIKIQCKYNKTFGWYILLGGQIRKRWYKDQGKEVGHEMDKESKDEKKCQGLYAFSLDLLNLPKMTWKSRSDNGMEIKL